MNPEAPEHRVATLDPALHATVRSRVPLFYALGADADTDRPAHVRAGSALSWSGTRLAVVQDDSNFVALVDPATGHTDVVTLAAGHEGRRQFDEHRGNKRWKLDLEASVRVNRYGDEAVIAFGSGSTAMRERVLLLRPPRRPGMEGTAADVPVAHLVDATALYASLRALHAFSGSELNIEGAALVGDRVRLFQRGNGAPRDGRLPIDAHCDVSCAALLAYLADPVNVAVPQISDVVSYELGAIDGVRLTFTDATAHGDRVFYLAAAEASPDTFADGPVSGVAIGVIAANGVTRWAVLRDESGAPFTAKAEGIALDPVNPDRAFVVLDRDDPALPSDLCVVELTGGW